MQKIISRKGGGIISKRVIQKVKDFLKYLLYSKILLGIGIGLIIGVLSMIGYKYENSISDAEIEKKALDLGMIYKDESKINDERND